ncbi:hypothetical protein FRB90_006153, partial [Tulasnella sp. 427]
MPSLITFNTKEVHLESNPQSGTSKVINLPQTYAAAPRIPVGLNSLDMKAGTAIRCHASASHIDNRRFTAHVDTWGDSVLYSGGINCFVMKPANLEFLTGEFAITQDPAMDKPELKTSRRINFERPFATAPNVVVFLTKLSFGGGKEAHGIKAFADNIDKMGFIIHIDTWDDTKIWEAIAGWIAYPADKDNIYSGTATTEQVRDRDNPSPGLTTQKVIKFDNTPFYAKPTVFLALSSIAVSVDMNLRINAYADDISTEGMTWHIDSWGDTRLHLAEISFIAFNE